MPVLAICIPTYNRLPYLRNCISRIRAQSPDVQIVVCDNASTDGTDAYMNLKAALDRNIIYVQQPRNLGFDANLLSAVEHATAEFCWLMGDDDYPNDFAIESVLSVLDSSVDALLLSRFLESSGRVQPFLGANHGARFRFLLNGDFERYVGGIQHMGSLFSFISCLVVRRSAWLAQPSRPSLVGSGYIHAARMLDMVNSGIRMMYLADPYVICREHDELLTEQGPGPRWMLDRNYLAILDAVFADDPSRRRALKRKVYWQLALLAADLYTRWFRSMLVLRPA